MVATNVGGNPELVLEGETGRLVPSQAPEQMAQAIKDYFSDPQQSAQDGKQGQQRARQLFSLEAMIDRYTVFYDNLLQC